MVRGLNHVTFAVADLDRSLRFYIEVLGFRLRMRKCHSAYLEAGTLWLALVVEESPTFQVKANGYSHLALSVAKCALSEAQEKLKVVGARCWQESEREDSYYFCDPDGHQLELHSGELEARC